MANAKNDTNDLTMRAAAAWIRWARANGGGVPTLDAISVEEVGGKTYVTWRERGEFIDCFRVRNDGKLKRLVRPPSEITDR